MALQANVCYRYGASGGLDLGMMEGCYRALGVGAGDAKRHVEQCHSNDDDDDDDGKLPWKGFESCLATSMDFGNQTERSVEFPLVMVNCMGRYGVEEEFLEVTAKMERFKVEKVGDATEGDELARRNMKCVV